MQKITMNFIRQNCHIIPSLKGCNSKNNKFLQSTKARPGRKEKLNKNDRIGSFVEGNINDGITTSILILHNFNLNESISTVCRSLTYLNYRYGKLRYNL